MTVIEIISKSILVYTWLYPRKRDIASVNAIVHPSGYLGGKACYSKYFIHSNYPGISSMTVIEIISKSILVYTWLYPRKFTQVLQNIEAS
jgi:hypothetical protein